MSNKTPEGARALMQELTNPTPVQPVEAESPTPSKDPVEQAEELVEEITQPEEEVIEEETEDDPLDPSDEESDENDEEESDEDEEQDGEDDVLSKKVETEHGEQSVEELAKFFNKHQGKLDAIARKEQEIAADRKKLDERNTIFDHIGVTRELQSEYYTLERKNSFIEKAEQAWLDGKEYRGLEGRALKDEIDRQSNLLGKEVKAFEEKQQQAIANLPGREELIKEAGLTESNWTDKNSQWKELAKEFGYQPEELDVFSDWRFWRVLNRMHKEIEENKSFRETKRKAKGKPSAPKQSSSGKQPANIGKPSSDPSFNEIREGVKKGDQRSKRAAMKHIFG